MASLSFVPSRKRWRVRWRATNRTTHRVFAGSAVFLEKDQAVRHWAEMEQQEKLWRTGAVQSIDAIADVVAEFTSYCRRHTPATQKLYRRVLERFIESLPGNVQRIQQIDSRMIESFLYQIRDSGPVNRTLNAYLTVVKAFCRYYSDRYTLPNPASRVTMLTEDPANPRFLSDEEYAKLLETAGEQARDRILFLANTGLRASEFYGLVKSGKLERYATAITVTGKGRRRRTIPLNQTCRDVLTRDHIFRPISRNPLYQQLNRVAKRAQIPPLGPHALRHYCATQMLIKGVPPAKVAAVLGHSVRVLERTYSHILPKDLQGTTDVLDAI